MNIEGFVVESRGRRRTGGDFDMDCGTTNTEIKLWGKMATPLPDFETMRGGGGVASSSTTVLTSSVSSSRPSLVANSFSEDA